jgi:LemA protein
MALRQEGLVGVIAAAIIALVAIWAVVAYNRLVRLRNQVRTAWADIDVQLTRRHDLVPQLVAAVKAYASHEQATLAAVTELRSRAVSLRGPAQLGAVETELEQALARVFALEESYPDLKANENFAQLHRDLVKIEEHLQYARRFYNGAVRDYNDAVQRVPDLAVARTFQFANAEFYQAQEAERAPVRVGAPA